MKALNYGELLAWYTKLPLIAFVEFGSYSGDYIAVMKNGDTVDFYKGHYGSCSGCDELERMRNYEDEVDEKEAMDFCEREFHHPFVSIPIETMTRIDVDTLNEIMPANVRSEIYDYDRKELHNIILSALNH